MYPQISVRTKVRMLPYFILIVVGLGVLDDAGYIDLAAATQASLHQPAGHKKKHHKPKKHRPAAVAPASGAARADIPANYLALYRQTGHDERWGSYPAWTVLAGIGQIESGHGQSQAPGVHSGVNSFGCCAGPMQFNIRNGSPSTWDTYGRGSPYDPADAIAAAKRLLVANGVRSNLDNALYSYNHAWWYVARVKANARRYAGRS